ncbi:MAG: hypothetical protein ABSH34_27195 [Verrucomicrobiota bacterium]|jgi:hypothetical protein
MRGFKSAHGKLGQEGRTLLQSTLASAADLYVTLSAALDQAGMRPCEAKSGHFA